MKERLTSVITTLQQLEIQSTYDNMNRLLGSIQELIRIRDTMPEKNGEAQSDGGEADA